MWRIVLSTVFMLSLAGPAAAQVRRKQFVAAGASVAIEVLDDDLIHVEVAATPSGQVPLFTSPMVLAQEHPGPRVYSERATHLETAGLVLDVDPTTLCLRFEDKRKAAYLARICPNELDQPRKRLEIAHAPSAGVYGLGQQFKLAGSTDGDWLQHRTREGARGYGNALVDFAGGAVGNVQVPVLYALGKGGESFGLFLDDVHEQAWDFTQASWQVRVSSERVRFYVMAGADLRALRSDYLALTGAPPVPPRKAFGMWVSEFGYDNWDEIDVLAAGLRRDGFPVDGFVLDLNWFGGIDPNTPSQSQMGRLAWDEDAHDGNRYAFPDPKTRIAGYQQQHLGIAAIEESYLVQSTETARQLPATAKVWERTRGACLSDHQERAVTTLRGFWGEGSMIDWSDPLARRWIHDQRRVPNLVDYGITVHWTDLGEPESFDPRGCYDGVEPGKHEHADLHNLYNLLWSQSIWDGYAAHRSHQRPLILTRSGSAGSQRFGTALWSGDIPSSPEALATHANAQLHMALSGFDYYGADTGGFRRKALRCNDDRGQYRGFESELYTQWFAYGAWFDVPLRPHTDNEFSTVEPPYQTAPNRVGHAASNLANLRERYALTPYYYSLAYRAQLAREPLIAPLVYYYQDDASVRGMGHEKLIGRDLLVGMIAEYGAVDRAMYLPAGTWIDYYSQTWLRSDGRYINHVPLYREGQLRLPAYARAGAILPRMFVDGQTLDVFGHRKSGARHDELIVRVYAAPTASQFTLYEDDGQTLDHDAAGRPRYRYRTTELRQQQLGNVAQVEILPALDVAGSQPIAELPSQRSNVIELVVDNASASAVQLDHKPLQRHTSAAAFAAAASGWLNAGPNLIWAKSTALSVAGTRKSFRFMLQPTAARASVHFVCDHTRPEPGESVYVVGSLPELGADDPARAIPLASNSDYAYFVNPPPATCHAGDFTPKWSGLVAGLPVDTAFTWRCLRKRADGSGALHWQPGEANRFQIRTSGYAGQTRGSW